MYGVGRRFVPFCETVIGACSLRDPKVLPCITLSYACVNITAHTMQPDIVSILTLISQVA